MEMLTPKIDTEGRPVFNPPEGESQVILNDVAYVVVKIGGSITIRKQVEYTTTTGVPVSFNNPMKKYWNGVLEHEARLKEVSRVPPKKAQWKRETTHRFR